MFLNKLDEKQMSIETSWIEAELEHIDLKDPRLNKRANNILSDQYSNPGGTIHGSSSSKASAKGAYRFFDNPKVNRENLLAPHKERTLERIRKEKVILLVNDTTELDFTSQPQKEGTGVLSYEAQRGFYLHPIIAATPDKLCLGVVDIQVIVRPVEEFGKSKNRAKLPIEDKESYKWILSYQAASKIQEELETTQAIIVGDRESDIYEFFVEASNDTSGLHFIVRAYHNRRLEKEIQLLWSHMDSLEESKLIEVQVPRKKGNPARMATCELKYDTVELKAPAQKNDGQPVSVSVVYVVEKNPPPDVEPISWMLLSDIAVTTPEQALQIVKYYIVRWQIEVYFKILKSGCKVEADQLETKERFENALIFYMIVAWRILYTTMLNRENPNVSCEIAFDEAEWKALWCYTNKTSKLPKEPPTLKEMTIMVAQLGGYKHWQPDSVPGVSTMWKGFVILNAITSMWKICQSIYDTS